MAEEQTSPDDKEKRSYADYVQDQLQQTRTTSDHAAILRKRAPARIKAAADAVGEHGGTPEGPADLTQYHAVQRLLEERAFYPPHDKRKESPAYAKIHHQMTIVDDKRCLVCGVKHSTLSDENANPFGAVQMETHHRTIEWALANAIDPVKFNQHIRPGLKRQAEQRSKEPDYADITDIYKIFDDLYENDMSGDDIKKWVDHAADNLWVLCDIHHRHKFVGIHAITYPIWGPQDVVNDITVAEEIKNAKSTHGNV